MAILVKLEKFEGPLDLLLQLIEKEELSVTDISLAKVTDEYISALKNAGKVNPEELADFLVVAAKLLLIKSKVLLPAFEVQYEEWPSLEEQLKLYREFILASREIEAIIKKKRFMFARTKPAIERVPEFSPPPRLKLKDLHAAYLGALKSLTPLLKLPRAATQRVVSIQEKIAHIREMILNQVAVKFDDIVKRAKSKTEAVVSFLALLELVKQRVVEAKQDALFHEITVHKVH